MLTYLELHQGRFGDKSTSTAKISEIDFALVTTLLSNEDFDEVMELLETDKGDIEPLKSNNMNFAFIQLLVGDSYESKNFARSIKKVLKDLNEKGFYAAMWEEGSHAICCEGYRKEAITAIAHIEAQVDQDSWGFDD